MYLPLGSSTLLHFLQLPLSLLNSDQQNLNSVVPDEQLGNHHHHHGCKDSKHFGSLSPYHDAPVVPGVSVDLPDDCSVDQVIFLHRHGSRGPVEGGDSGYILKLVNTLRSDKAKDAIQAADLPPYLEFLKEGYKYEVPPEDLTIVGRRELFNHGVEFAFRYPTFSTDEVVSTTVPRVIDSAHFFSQGFFGREAENITFLTTKDFTDPVSWLDTWKSCPGIPYIPTMEAVTKWANVYIPPIVERLNELIPGVDFTPDDIHGALYACPYDLAAGNKSPWCDVFAAHDFRDLEYEQDMALDLISGHKSRGDAGPLTGAFYIKKLVERLTNATEDTKPLYLDFGHDITILMTLSAMGLNKDAVPLSPDHPHVHRKFRSSYQVPFAAEMVWERFTCKHSFKGPQVRLLLNRATLPLSICENSKRDQKFGTCSLDAFVQANRDNLDVQYQSSIWNATCEVGQ